MTIEKLAARDIQNFQKHLDNVIAEDGADVRNWRNFGWQARNYFPDTYFEGDVKGNRMVLRGNSETVVVIELTNGHLATGRIISVETAQNYDQRWAKRTKLAIQDPDNY